MAPHQTARASLRKRLAQGLAATGFALTAAGGALAAPTQIEFWYGETGDNYIQAMETIVGQFNANHPDIQVKLVEKGYIGGDQLDAFLATIAAGVPPDVAYVDGTTAMEFGLSDNAFIPLNQVMPAGELDRLDFLPVPHDAFNYNGVWYGVAMRTDSRAIYTNARLFADAGLDARAGWKDINAFDQIADKVTRRDAQGKIEVLGFAPKGNNFGGDIAWLWAFGAKVYDRSTNRPVLDGDPNAIAAMEWIGSYAKRYGPAARTRSGDFENEKVAMYLTSTTPFEEYTHLPFDWWMNEIPYPAEGRKITFSSTRGPAIPRGSKHPQEAAKFMLYLVQPDIQAFWYRQTGSLPSNTTAFRSILSEVKDPRQRTIIGLVPYAITYPPFFAKTVRPAFEDQAQAMRELKVTPQEALANIQKAALPIFERVFGDKK